jgi:sugar transferase (PEP-CTERM/EpsH1 system associated)
MSNTRNSSLLFPVFAQAATQAAPQKEPTLRVLYFAPKECWPPDTGAKLRNYYLARALARHARVTRLGFSENGHELTNDTAVNDGTGCERIVTVPRPRGYTLSNLLRGAITKTPLPVLNYTSREMSRELARLLEAESFDAVQVESAHLAAYLPIIQAARKRPLMICDWHNVESELMRRYSEQSQNFARRLYARMTANRLATLERQLLSVFDAHTVVSERDRERLRAIAPDARVHVIENGVDTDYFSDYEIERACTVHYLATAGAAPGRAHRERQRILFVGSMDYHANIGAVVSFAREVWPQIYARNPQLNFTIAGRNPTPEVRALSSHPGIEVTGTIADVRPFYREAAVAVVPLRVGAGSRLKILEAMAAGVPVVSTRLGAEGLNVQDGENIIIADENEKLAEAIISIASGADRWRQMAEAARRHVRIHYEWSAIGARLVGLHERLAGRDHSNKNEEL